MFQTSVQPDRRRHVEIQESSQLRQGHEPAGEPVQVGLCTTGIRQPKTRDGQGRIGSFIRSLRHLAHTSRN